jgi:acyl-CoA reductase-like NAD-dependent aldehyde dehydrogenase
VIFDDANLEECVATSIRSSFANQGEICLCGARIFVQEGIYQKFMDKFIEKVISSNLFNTTSIFYQFVTTCPINSLLLAYVV